MGIPLHVLDIVGGTPSTQNDRLSVVAQANLPNPVGSGAGVVVSVPVVFAEKMPTANYAAFVEANQDATTWASAKTTSGFTANIQPRLATVTLAAGTFDILILA
jgi:hypothetical protein